ncbi:MAG: hypothetical protein M0Z85_03130 [Gammaproteobacteria bacterium]|nr:hypothetical protein [Gammaproteobacteria bacterium]
MNTNERNTDARSQVIGHAAHNGSPINTEGFKLQQSAGVKEISLVQATAGLGVLNPFVSRSQMRAIWDLCRDSEEKAYFKQKVMDLARLIKSMPKTYDQDGSGMEAVAYLHYFTAGFDWYITEKDMTGDGTAQAFGLAVVFERELGYISIREIIANGAELDLHFEPVTLSALVDGRTVRI